MSIGGGSPPGRQPTLAQYIAWARSVGCTVGSGQAAVIRSGVRRLVPWVRITPPPGNGSDLYIFGHPIGPLAPSVVRSYDARIGIKSRWSTS
jgi:hypothetical protein